MLLLQENMLEGKYAKGWAVYDMRRSFFSAHYKLLKRYRGVEQSRLRWHFQQAVHCSSLLRGIRMEAPELGFSSAFI